MDNFVLKDNCIAAKILAESDSWEQEHDKMMKTNYWYKAWHEQMVIAHAAIDKLSNLSSTVSIYLEDYEKLPPELKRDWDGYVLITENSIKTVMKTNEAVKKDLAELKRKTKG